MKILARTELSISDMKKDITRTKRKLEKEDVIENFGQDEVRRISDKYASLQQDYYSEYSQLIQNFSDWCSNYTGR